MFEEKIRIKVYNSMGIRFLNHFIYPIKFIIIITILVWFIS